MLTALVVLWLGAPGELEAHRSAIADWASAHGVLVTAPAKPSGPRYDARLADEVETLLEQARTEAPGSNALERAEAVLFAHPELPQAAWLLSERHALEAQAAAARGEPTHELWARAQAFEGQRAATAGTEPATLATLAGGAPTTPCAISGPRRFDRLYVDGVLVGPDRGLSEGRHHVQLVRGSATVSVAWVEAEPGSPLVLVDPTPACGVLDLAGVNASRTGALEPPPGILCKRWLAARRGPLGGTEITSCQESRCRPWEPTRRPLAAAPAEAPVAEAAPGASWPAWLTWSLLGAGAAAATGLVLWQTGAFEQPAPSTEFVFSGPDVAAYRF